ncbi:MAG: fasciclin domain-containing protein [Gammaproteobacteria bacterium]|nr:fasciclin domain-containing protein [Gammaproteobacteria bacterium]
MKKKLISSMAALGTCLMLSLPLSLNAANGPDPSLVDIAVKLNAPGGAAEGQFDTLIAAVLVADPAVLETLSGYGQRTVFAPTDDAFAALGLDESNVGDLDQTVLTQILLYHVAPGRRAAVSVTRKNRIRMLFGGFLRQQGGVLTDNTGGKATIIVTDQFAQNGVIHAIDSVVLPYAL